MDPQQQQEIVDMLNKLPEEFAHAYETAITSTMKWLTELSEEIAKNEKTI